MELHHVKSCHQPLFISIRAVSSVPDMTASAFVSARTKNQEFDLNMSSIQEELGDPVKVAGRLINIS